MHPEAYSLSAVNWQLFVSLTLPDRLLEAGDARLGSVLFAWLRRVAAGNRTHFHRLEWVCRSELGERTRRLHFHCLLAGLQNLTQRERFRVKNAWETTCGAMARVTRYDSALPGVGYVLKGGVAYELSKFSRSADVVIVSKSVQRVVERRAEVFAG